MLKDRNETVCLILFDGSISCSFRRHRRGLSEKFFLGYIFRPRGVRVFTIVWI